jgi:hypothetical protein
MIFLVWLRRIDQVLSWGVYVSCNMDLYWSINLFRDWTISLQQPCQWILCLELMTQPTSPFHNRCKHDIVFVILLYFVRFGIFNCNVSAGQIWLRMVMLDFCFYFCCYLTMVIFLKALQHIPDSFPPSNWWVEMPIHVDKVFLVLLHTSHFTGAYFQVLLCTILSSRPQTLTNLRLMVPCKFQNCLTSSCRQYKMLVFFIT